MAAVYSARFRHEVIMQIRIQGSSEFFPKQLISAFDEVDGTLRRVERQLTTLASREFGLGDEFVQNTVQALSSLSNRRVIIQKTYSGSLVFEAAVAGAALLLLRYTIMESVKAGWSQTELHSKIEKFICNATNIYGELIAEQWSQQGRRAKVYYRFGRKVVRIKITPPEDGQKVTLGNVRMDYDSLMKRIERYWESIRKPSSE